jgi:DNA polymerase sigma
MPPKNKDGASKKNEKKKKEKLLEDRTFGLKNKNKSKKVQQYIQGVAANVYTVDPKQRRLDEERKRAKENAKLHKKAMEEEQNALFGAALLAVQKKGAVEKGTVEAKGRDADDDGNKKAGTSRAMKMMFQMDAQEMEDRLKEDVSICIYFSRSLGGFPFW